MANVRKLITTHDQVKFDHMHGTTEITLLEQHECPPGFIAVHYLDSVYYLKKDHVVMLQMSIPVAHVD